MSLGQKLAAYRRANDLTQQQLGNRLNLSAQAVSKWENDLSEPDITTLRQLADIYEVTLDELLDLSEEAYEDEAEEEDEEEETPDGAPNMIGVCRECGITVTEDNFGEHNSVLLCSRCVAIREEKKKKDIEEKRRARERERQEAKRSVARSREAIIKRTKTAFIVSGIIFVFSLFSMILTAISASEQPNVLAYNPMVEHGTLGGIAIYAYSLYCIFSFTFCLFFGGTVRAACAWGWIKGIRTPLLITTFDLDGLLWLIGMKLLFWVLGILIALVCGILGILVGLYIIAPFSFVHILFVLRRDYASGEPCDLLS